MLETSEETCLAYLQRGIQDWSKKVCGNVNFNIHPVRLCLCCPWRILSGESARMPPWKPRICWWKCFNVFPSNIFCFIAGIKWDGSTLSERSTAIYAKPYGAAWCHLPMALRAERHGKNISWRCGGSSPGIVWQWVSWHPGHPAKKYNGESWVAKLIWQHILWLVAWYFWQTHLKNHGVRRNPVTFGRIWVPESRVPKTKKPIKL